MRKASKSWDRSAVGPTFLRPTSARSSRLRSTVVSPRILFTSGRSGSGTCSSTSSQSDWESLGMARPRRCPPDARSLIWTCGTAARSAGLPIYCYLPRAGHTHSRLASFRVSQATPPACPSDRPLPSLIPFGRPSPRLELLGPEPLASGALFCSTTDRLSEARVSGRGPGSQEALAPPLPRGRHLGNGPSTQAPPPEGPGPAHSRAVPASKAQPTAVVGGFAVSAMLITQTPSTFHPWAPLDSRAGERTEKYESGGFITSMPFLGQERTRLFKEDK